MATYATVYDPTKPLGTDQASTVDDELRNLKSAITERLVTVFPGWPSADPLVLNPSVFPVVVPQVYSGTLAARPNPPTAASQWYVATDTGQTFISVVSGATFTWQEVKATTAPVVASQLMVNAGDDQFKPLGTETRATRVKNAINAAKLTSSPNKVVYVPQVLWGYISDLDFNIAMFDASILMVRDGGVTGWYDPIAYGADRTGTTNSRSVIDLAYLHASTTTVGAKLVAFTVPGTYLMTTDVDQRGVARFIGAGVTFGGAGTFSGSRPFSIPADPTPAIDAAFNYNASGAGAKAVVATVTKRLHVVLTGTTDSGGKLVLSFADTGFAGAYAASNLVTCVASNRKATTTATTYTRVLIDTVGNTVTVDADDGTQTNTWDLFMTFSA